MKIKFTDEQATKILEYWNTWHNIDSCEFNEVWRGYNLMSNELLIPINTLKNFIKYLRDNNICYHAPTINNEYIPCGSGNFLKEHYQNLSWKQVKEIINVIKDEL